MTIKIVDMISLNLVNLINLIFIKIKNFIYLLTNSIKMDDEYRKS